MVLAMKRVPEERTARFLDEIDRAEKIFRKMFDAGELETEINRAKDAQKAAEPKHTAKSAIRIFMDFGCSPLFGGRFIRNPN